MYYIACKRTLKITLINSDSELHIVISGEQPPILTISFSFEQTKQIKPPCNAISLLKQAMTRPIILHIPKKTNETSNSAYLKIMI